MDRFADLTWDDIENWAGGKVVSQGRKYQQQGCVADLAVTADGGLIAWVDGSVRYAAKVVVDEEGLPDSVCTCPYGPGLQARGGRGARISAAGRK